MNATQPVFRIRSACALAIGLLLLAVATGGRAHEYNTFEELMRAFNTDLDATEVRVQTVAPGLHVLLGAGGNVVVSIGEQGVLMVDSQYAEMVPKLTRAIENLGGDGIDFTINTHWHFDHNGGNALLGRDGSWFVAQRNSRRMMMNDHAIDLVNLHYMQPRSADEALPVVTFDDAMQMHLNGDTIDLLHFGPAHTTGDTIIHFRNANVVHMGDVFNARYPFVDAGNGGHIDGMIRACREVLARLDSDSVVVPGHGPVSGYDDLETFVIMLETVRDRVNAMIDSGYTLDEVIAARPTAEFDERYGDPARLIDRAYLGLSRRAGH